MPHLLVRYIGASIIVALTLATPRLVAISFVGFGVGGDNDIALTNLTLTGGAYALSFSPQVRRGVRVATAEQCRFPSAVATAEWPRLPGTDG